MLPESQFPVTGGIMQTEEVVPRAQSTGLVDGTAPDPATPSLQHQHSPQPTQPPQSQLSPALAAVRFAPQLSPQYPSFGGMAVKQEPQEEDERPGRQPSALSPQTEIEDAQISHEGHKEQSSPQFESPSAQAPQQNGCKKPASRGRRKSRWKLKFHHQALPPEYLDHYEAALAQEAALQSSTTTVPPVDPHISSPASTPVYAPTPNPITDVQSWLQRLAAMQNEIYANPMQASNLCPTTTTAAARRSVITSTTQSVQTPQMAFNHRQPQLPQQQQIHVNQNSHRSNNAQIQQSPRPPMKYSDLPYMGEITLDNSKPRRGRKPKKADICHLIYKNYGTILPGTPGLTDDKSKSPPENMKDTQLPIPFQRTDIQNRISSLLEKRLTQERRALEISVDDTKEQEEPLNLCIRDLNLLKIRLNEKHNSAFGSCHSRSDGSSDAEDIEYLGPSCQNLIESEHQTESNSEVNSIECKAMDVDNRIFMNNNGNQVHGCNSELGEANGTTNDFINNNGDAAAKQNAGLLYWPNAGVFIHPATLQSQLLYYQKLAQDKGLAVSEQPGIKEQRIVPKSIYSMLDNTKVPITVPTGVPPTTNQMSEPSPPMDPPTVSTPSPRPKRNSTSQGQSLSNQPMKRKRSAIFIPPMPSENNNNPATEVSICKFKFTGGAKPTLQEKKSLSVDSGGNFRYYSGTGDKSMRGYEFFPRESLQQPANHPGGSNAGAFLSATSERLPQPVPVSPRPCSVTPDDNRRKRKTRKSIQREKLEQTFKEKGFLIQTQQLQSAEGATYCKFRQLRKFTRYLFRSWKDYLPGNVRELNDAAGGEQCPASLKEVAEQDGEVLPQPPISPGLTLPSIELQPSLIENSPPSLPID